MTRLDLQPLGDPHDEGPQQIDGDHPAIVGLALAAAALAGRVANVAEPSMPRPKSRTLTTTSCSRAPQAITILRSLSRPSEPRACPYLSALSIRLAQIWFSSPAKPRTRGSPGSICTATSADFDRAFMPTQAHTAERWKSVDRAHYQSIGLPPVSTSTILAPWIASSLM